MTTDTTDTQERPPTMAQVRAQAEKAGELREKAVELEAREKELGQAIAEALAAGEDPSGLREERADVRGLLEDMRLALPIIDERTAAMREAASRAEAERRFVAIKRAFGSVKNELEADGDRLMKAADEFASRAGKANERYQRTEELRAEGAALVKRFDLGKLDLPAVLAPARMESVRKAWKIVQTTTSWARAPGRAFGQRLPPVPADCPGSQILREAGPKPESDEERQEREAREARVRRRAEREAEQDRQFAEAVRGRVPPDRASAGRTVPGR